MKSTQLMAANIRSMSGCIVRVCIDSSPGLQVGFLWLIRLRPACDSAHFLEIDFEENRPLVDTFLHKLDRRDSRFHIDVSELQQYDFKILNEPAHLLLVGPVQRDREDVRLLDEFPRYLLIPAQIER